MKKVRPSKTWTPPAKPQPTEEEEEKKEELEKRKEEELEKRKEEKPVPKPEQGKMLCSGDSSRLTRKTFPGTSGQDLGRGGKDLTLLGVCILERKEECQAIASQHQRERKGRSSEIKGFLLFSCVFAGLLIKAVTPTAPASPLPPPESKPKKETPKPKKGPPVVKPSGPEKRPVPSHEIGNIIKMYQSRPALEPQPIQPSR